MGLDKRFKPKILQIIQYVFDATTRLRKLATT
jgi:hypothetical protein